MRWLGGHRAVGHNVALWNRSHVVNSSPSVPPWRSLHACATARAGAGDGNPFTLGVCAGDPDDRSAVLWTRLTQPDGSALGADDVAVTWEVAGDESFTSVVANGEVTGERGRRRTARPPRRRGRSLVLPFRSGDWTSPPGGSRPTGADPAQLRLATTNCQHYETGYFAAYDDLAEWAPDLVVFLGDFIYEYGGENLGGAVVRSHGSGETLTVDEYAGVTPCTSPTPSCSRPGGRSVVGDLGRPRSGEQLRRVDVRGRCSPRRVPGSPARRLPGVVGAHAGAHPRPGDVDTVIYRTIQWDSLADVMLLEGASSAPTRRAATSSSLDGPGLCGDRRPGTMLGSVQEQWLGAQLALTTATWPVIAQQTVLSDVHPAQRCGAQLRPVGRLPGGPPAAAPQGCPGTQGGGADWRHPSRRRRPVAGGRG